MARDDVAGAAVRSGSPSSMLLGPYAALRHRFEVATDHPFLAAWLGDVLAPLRSDEAPATRYRLADDGPAHLFCGEELVAEGTHSHVVAMLLWHLNREAVVRSSSLVRLHAAVAARGDVGVVLPAEMEAGKTTLVAGLVQAGLQYLSDEVAAVEPHTLRVLAYPKALSIDPGSWGVLAHLRPASFPDPHGLLPHQWIVPADDIRPGATSRSAAARLLIAPRYEEGASTRLEPLGRADALLHAAAATFDLRDDPARDLGVLGRLVRGCDCYRLVVGDLATACELVLAALDRIGGTDGAT